MYEVLLQAYSLYLIFHKSNMTGVTSGATTAYPKGVHEFTPGLLGFVLLLSYNCTVLQIILCPFSIFLTAFVLSVLQLTASYDFIGFFKLSLITLFTLEYDLVNLVSSCDVN
jgi:hypothetical protein